MENNLDTTKPRYSEHISIVPLYNTLLLFNHFQSVLYDNKQGKNWGNDETYASQFSIPSLKKISYFKTVW